MPNGIDLILADHARVADLFDHATKTDRPSAVAIGQIVDGLLDHDEAEHAALYPLAREVLGDAGMLDRFEAAHARVKAHLDELRQLEGQPLLASTLALREIVEVHVRDEEDRLLPALADAATATQLETLGARIEQNKQRVG